MPPDVYLQTGTKLNGTAMCSWPSTVFFLCFDEKVVAFNLFTKCSSRVQIIIFTAGLKRNPNRNSNWTVKYI